MMTTVVRKFDLDRKIVSTESTVLVKYGPVIYLLMQTFSWSYLAFYHFTKRSSSEVQTVLFKTNENWRSIKFLNRISHETRKKNIDSKYELDIYIHEKQRSKFLCQTTKLTEFVCYNRAFSKVILYSVPVARFSQNEGPDQGWVKFISVKLSV